MRWDHPPSIRCDIVFFSGINFSGHRRLVRFWGPSGRQGDEVIPEDCKSVAIIAPMRTRVTLIGTELEEDWETTASWRAIELREGHTYETKEGKTAVRIPDLDCLDKVNALRTDPDFSESFAYSESLDDRPAWTYGRIPRGSLKGAIHAVKVERLPKEE